MTHWKKSRRFVRLESALKGKTAKAAALALIASVLMLAPANHACASTFDVPDGDIAALLAAIDAANADPDEPAVINLAPNSTYILTEVNNSLTGNNGLPAIASVIVINGNGATIRRSSEPGTPHFRILRVSSTGELTLNDLSIASGQATVGGGSGIFNQGTLTLSGCTIRGNTGPGTNGGGIHNSNTAMLTNCTISGNSANTGGGIANVSTAAGSLSLIHCTITENHASISAGGIRVFDGPVSISNTIIAGNTTGISGPNILGPYADAGFNIVEDGSGVAHPSSMSGNPNLGPLLDNGGPTPTHALPPESIALNAGDCHGGVITHDQRGIPRPQPPGGGGVGGACDVGAFERGPFDVAHADVSALIDAIALANASDAATTINLAAGGEYILTQINNRTGTGGPNGLPAIESGIVIQGNGATIRRSDAPGTPDFRILAVGPTGDLTIRNVTVGGGHAATMGGGVLNNGSFTGIASTISGNAAATGGAVHNSNDAQFMNCTISGNSANAGGGIANSAGGAGSLLLVNCTLSDNSAKEGAGGGIRIIGGSAALSNTIVANSVGGDVVGTYIDSGYNIMHDGSGIAHPTSMSGDPQLGPLADNTGPTFTHALQSGSMAIDAGDCGGGTILVDQRGIVRPQPPGGGAGACDIGAYEQVQLNVPDGNVAALIEAINIANEFGATSGAATTINLADDGVYLLTEVHNVSTGPNGLPVIASNLTINGHGATIQRAPGSPSFRLFNVVEPGNLTLNHVSVAGGANSNNGGGIYISGGSLTLIRCTVMGNSTTLNGGGIFSTNGTTVVMIDSTIVANSTTGVGGGASIRGIGTLSGCTFTGNSTTPQGSGAGLHNLGDTSLVNCTISANTAGGAGGGVMQFSANGSLTLANCTIAGNSANGGPGGIWNIDGLLSITNTIVAGNSPPPPPAAFGDISGQYADEGYNIVADGSGITHPTSMSGNPNLAPLAENGGPTLTHALLSGSVAIDGGDCAGGQVTIDQRGVVRPQGSGCDIGAFEVEVPTCPPPGALPADLNCDGVVGVVDLLILLAAWGPCPDQSKCPADFNGDGVVGVGDLLFLLSSWG